MIRKTPAPDLEEKGPVIEVLLQPIPELVKALKQSRIKALKEIRVNALIDTGAQGSAIPEDIASELGLNIVGFTPVETVLGFTVRLPLYAVRLSIHNHEVDEKWVLIGVPALYGDHGCLLGRDFLKFCKFNYDGPDRSFSLDCRFECDADKA